MIIDHLKAFRNYNKYDGEIGLEIETSTKRPYDVPAFTYWTTHRDDSVRDFGQEYVLKQPLKFKDELPLALQEFEDKTKTIKFIKDPQSAGVHIHLNFLKETFLCLGNFLTLYTLFENLLIEYSGPDRKSNLFCLPICDAEETYKNICNLFKQVANKNYKGVVYNEQNVKYAALNLAALYMYGSIEIRSFKGETDIKNINTWVSIIYSMLEYARGARDPKDIMLEWKNLQVKLMDNVFGPYAKELNFKDTKELIEKNVWYAASIAYSVKDWKILDIAKEIPKFKASQKDMDATAVQYFGRMYADLAPGEAEHVIHLLKKNWAIKHGIAPEPIPVFEAPPVAPRRQARVRNIPLPEVPMNPAAEQPMVAEWEVNGNDFNRFIIDDQALVRARQVLRDRVVGDIVERDV